MWLLMLFITRLVYSRISARSYSLLYGTNISRLCVCVTSLTIMLGMNNFF